MALLSSSWSICLPLRWSWARLMSAGKGKGKGKSRFGDGRRNAAWYGWGGLRDLYEGLRGIVHETDGILARMLMCVRKDVPARYL